MIDGNAGWRTVVAVNRGRRLLGRRSRTAQQQADPTGSVVIRLSYALVALAG
jgi:hypothetical protein